MKTTKKILTLVLALALIFALAAPSFAIVDDNQPVYGQAPYYVQDTISDYYVSGTFTVYLSIYSGIYDSNGPIETVLAVPMGSANATNQLYTVEDVLVAAHTYYPSYSFNIQHNVNTLMGYYASWLQGVSKSDIGSGVWFEALPLHYNGNSTAYPGGWMFRVNGMIPFYIPSGSTNPIGCLISDAYVTANDVIDLYYDNIYTQALATRVVTIQYVGDNNGAPGFVALASQSYYTNAVGEDWHVTSWALLTNSSFTVKVGSNSYDVSTDGYGYFELPASTHGTDIMFTSVPFPANYPITYNDGNITHYYRVPYWVGMYVRVSF